jgi:hypothetical protein
MKERATVLSMTVPPRRSPDNNPILFYSLAADSNSCRGQSLHASPRASPPSPLRTLPFYANTKGV